MPCGLRAIQCPMNLPEGFPKRRIRKSVRHQHSRSSCRIQLRKQTHSTAAESSVALPSISAGITSRTSHSGYMLTAATVDSHFFLGAKTEGDEYEHISNRSGLLLGSHQRQFTNITVLKTRNLALTGLRDAVAWDHTIHFHAETTSSGCVYPAAYTTR
jgi:hypothetical protein